MKIFLAKYLSDLELSLHPGARASTSPRLPRRTTSLARSASMPSRPSPLMRRTKREVMGEEEEEEEQCIKYTFYPSSRDGSPALVITECEDQPLLRPCLKPNSRWHLCFHMIVKYFPQGKLCCKVCEDPRSISFCLLREGKW